MNKVEPKLLSDKIGITDLQLTNKDGKKGKWVLKLFDTETGEIFEDSTYNVVPFKNVDPLPRFAKCEEDALSFRSTMDKKFTGSYYKTFGDLQTIKEHHGESILKQILCITKHVCVHNVSFIKRGDLCEIFSCSAANLNRKLNSLEKRNLIKFETKGLSHTKTIKVLLHPFVFWYGGSRSKIEEWLNYWCYKSDSVKDYEQDTMFFGKNYDTISDNISVEDLGYNISYDIGVFDDSREYIGDRGYLVSESRTSNLTEDQLIYLLYGV